MFIPPGIENVYPGCGFSLWSRAGNSHVLRRALSLAPANRGRGLQPHPAGGCGQVQQVTPHSAGAKKHMFCHLNLNVYSGRLGKESSRPRSRFIGAMETTPKTMAWECFLEGKHSQQVRTCSFCEARMGGGVCKPDFDL